MNLQHIAEVADISLPEGITQNPAFPGTLSFEGRIYRPAKLFRKLGLTLIPWQEKVFSLGLSLPTFSQIVIPCGNLWEKDESRRRRALREFYIRANSKARSCMTGNFGSEDPHPAETLAHADSPIAIVGFWRDGEIWARAITTIAHLPSDLAPFPDLPGAFLLPSPTPIANAYGESILFDLAEFESEYYLLPDEIPILEFEFCGEFLLPAVDGFDLDPEHFCLATYGEFSFSAPGYYDIEPKAECKCCYRDFPARESEEFPEIGILCPDCVEHELVYDIDDEPVLRKNAAEIATGEFAGGFIQSHYLEYDESLKTFVFDLGDTLLVELEDATLAPISEAVFDEFTKEWKLPAGTTHYRAAKLSFLAETMIIAPRAIHTTKNPESFGFIQWREIESFLLRRTGYRIPAPDIEGIDIVHEDDLLAYASHWLFPQLSLAA